MIIFVALRVARAVAVFIAAVADTSCSQWITFRISSEFAAVAVLYALLVTEILRNAEFSKALHVAGADIINYRLAFSVGIRRVVCIALAVVTCFA
jgi:hypothetical protein